MRVCGQVALTVMVPMNLVVVLPECVVHREISAANVSEIIQ